MNPKAEIAIWLTDHFWLTLLLVCVIPVLIYFVIKN